VVAEGLIRFISLYMFPEKFEISRENGNIILEVKDHLDVGMIDAITDDISDKRVRTIAKKVLQVAGLPTLSVITRVIFNKAFQEQRMKRYNKKKRATR
jgi:hypothetical protein